MQQSGFTRVRTNAKSLSFGCFKVFANKMNKIQMYSESICHNFFCNRISNYIDIKMNRHCVGTFTFVYCLNFEFRSNTSDPIQCAKWRHILQSQHTHTHITFARCDIRIQIYERITWDYKAFEHKNQTLKILTLSIKH